MFCTTQTFTQAHTVFGGGYVLEQHGDETHRYLPASERYEFVVDFTEVLKALRCRRGVGWK
jgi:hypothetical protein